MILLVLFSFCACDIDKIEEIDISNIEVDFSVKRFDIDYYTAINGNILLYIVNFSHNTIK